MFNNEFYLSDPQSRFVVNVYKITYRALMVVKNIIV